MIYLTTSTPVRHPFQPVHVILVPYQTSPTMSQVPEMSPPRMPPPFPNTQPLHHFPHNVYTISYIEISMLESDLATL